MKRIFHLLMAFAILAGLVGCTYESRDFTEHEPGVYKGVNDPLLAKLAKQETQQELIDRVKLVQTDR